MSTLRNALSELLSQAIASIDAQFGSLQAYNADRGRLELVVQKGFDDSFYTLFRTVRPSDSTACARAFRQGRRVVIPDVEVDPQFEPYVPFARSFGFRAVQSTPIVSDGGCVVGVMSTHFANVHYVSPSAERALDALADRAGVVIAARDLKLR